MQLQQALIIITHIKQTTEQLFYCKCKI